MGDVVPLMAGRRREARLLADAFRALAETFGPRIGADILHRAVEAEAEAAGHAYAAAAPDGPSLHHFAGALARWADEGGIELGPVREEHGGLLVEVVRCRYRELHQAAGLPREVAMKLACGRESAFVRGYDPRLTREVLSQEEGDCALCFRWTDPPHPDETPCKARTRLKLRS